LSLPPDEPTEVLGDDSEPPTERLGQPPTEQLGQPPVGDSRRRGIWMLVASIAAGLILVGIYIAAGGLDYKPAGAADPCDAREWTDPGNLEESAQQFALSAIDGAACDLGVSREELTRALADDESRQAFAEENDLSDDEIETAVRSGLNRAIDDAEDAGVISGIAVTGLRTVVRFMPLDQMIELATDASSMLDSGQLDDVSGLIEGVVGSLGGDTGDTGTTDDSTPEGSGTTGNTGSIGEQIQEGITDQLPDSVQENLPDGLKERVQDELNGILNSQ
jgi:hypothetical protein